MFDERVNIFAIARRVASDLSKVKKEHGEHYDVVGLCEGDIFDEHGTA